MCNYLKIMKCYFIWNADVNKQEWNYNSDEEISECEEYDYNADVYIDFKLEKYNKVAMWLANNHAFRNMVEQFTHNEYEGIFSCESCKLITFKYATLTEPKLTSYFFSSKKDDENLHQLLRRIKRTNDEVYIMLKKVLHKELINIILTKLYIN